MILMNCVSHFVGCERTVLYTQLVLIRIIIIVVIIIIIINIIIIFIGIENWAERQRRPTQFAHN